ncbi:MAG: carbohydrate ABC transporter permease [Candidatus Excrementavichristensenella sp.]|jgi:raffinose/stachyose/melibiose transport system permease protein
MQTPMYKKVARAAVLSFFGLVILYPIFLVVISSFRTNAEIMLDLFGMPKRIMIDNYATVWTKSDIPVYLKNSLINTSGSVCAILVLASLVAFVCTRPDCLFKKPLYLLFTLGIAIPMQVGIISEYLMMARMKLLNSNLGLILIHTAYGLPMAVFIMYNFFRTIPMEIQESAIVDGCGNFQLYSRIVMPISTPVLTSVTIFSLVAIWNDLFFPLIMVSKKALKTLPLGLIAFQGEFITDYGVLFAGVVAVSIPLATAYLLLQKKFVVGMTAGALKG